MTIKAEAKKDEVIRELIDSRASILEVARELPEERQFEITLGE